jgi:hypothetical protein
MENLFIKYIKEGKIRSLEELKKIYHRIVMKTHPDAVGSNKLVDKYLQYSNYYDEAKKFIWQMSGEAMTPTEHETQNYRLLFYKEYYKLEIIDKPYAFNKHFHTQAEILLAKQRSFEYFSKWKKENINLYEQANNSYEQIKTEKPRGPYRKYALLFNLSPVFHNILSFQMTGLFYYKNQLKQNLTTVFTKLEERRMYPLIDFIQLLIRDMENGPVIHEVN